MYLISNKSSTQISISPKDIAKLGIIVYIFYICWYMPSFGDRRIILYGTALISCLWMIIDLIINEEKIDSLFPYGILNNFVMCIYSILTGMFVARNLIVLFSQVKTYFAFSSMCLVCCYISKKEKSIDWIAKTFVAVSTVCCLHVLTHGFYKNGYGYVLSEKNNPNSLGLILNVGIFSVAYLCKENLISIMTSIAFASLFAYCIIGCGSRKCLIGAVMMCLFWMLPMISNVMREHTLVEKALILILLACLIFIVICFLRQSYLNSDSFKRMQSLGRNEGSSTLRKYYYETAIKAFLEHPLFGIGFSQFIFYNSQNSYSHSTYAESLACWGGLGSLVYFGPMIIAVYRLCKLIIQNSNGYRSKMVMALVFLELFLGAGTIFFYNAEHIIAWAMIYLYVEYEGDKEEGKTMVGKYVKA